MHERPVTLTFLARHLRVSADWLRAEASAGRLPHVRAGDQLLFNLRLVEQLILRRASQPEVVHDRFN
jgi:hypothetical protein